MPEFRILVSPELQELNARMERHFGGCKVCMAGEKDPIDVPIEESYCPIGVSLLDAQGALARYPHLQLEQAGLNWLREYNARTAS